MVSTNFKGKREKIRGEKPANDKPQGGPTRKKTS